MRHWSQLGIRNWSAKPGRTVAALIAIALGVGVVVWVTCAYESVRLALQDQVWFWIGRSHLSVESSYGNDGTVFEKIADELLKEPNIAGVTCRLTQRVTLHPLVREARPSSTSEPASVKPVTHENGHATSTMVHRAHRARLGRLRQTLPPDRGLGLDVGDGDDYVELEGGEVQAVGIDPKTEYTFRKYDEERVAGRMLKVDDTGAAVIDRRLAEDQNLKLGDRILLRGVVVRENAEPEVRTATFKIVGVVDRRQVAKQQPPMVMVRLDMLQHLVGYDTQPRRVTKIDILLTDTSPTALSRTEKRVRFLVDQHRQEFLVRSSQSKLAHVKAAEEQSGFVLMLVSSVALFTAFFIILSTLSIGMLERLGQLGTLRCLGVTRLQMAAIVLSEAVPLGFVGILLGVPIGFGLAKLSVIFAKEYIGQFAISWQGLAFALGGGAVTTLAGALLPVVQAMFISPLRASRPQSRPTSSWLSVAAMVVGVSMIAAHSILLVRLSPVRWFRPATAISGVALLYCGYALITPFLVLLFGHVAVRVAAVVLRIRHQLLSDQVGRAAWRSGAICCGLMVGLSLIVSVVVHSQSLAAGWDFPKEFCEAFVYCSPPIRRELADEIRHIRGIADSALVNESIRCTVYGRGLFSFPISRFVAGDPEDFFRIANLQFLAGNKADAIAKLDKGGYILVTQEFVRAQKKGYGERVTIKAGKTASFEIAGVVTSPALDIASNYFNAGGQLVQASVFVVLGTMADAQKYFGIPPQVSMFLINFDLPTTTPAYPPEFDGPAPRIGDPRRMVELLDKWGPMMPERGAQVRDVVEQNATYFAGNPDGRLSWSSIPLLNLFRSSLSKVVGDWDKLTPFQRWQTYREELVMQLVTYRAGSAGEMHASVRALKLQIDHDLRRATLLFTTVPIVALIVAALGVGNLMTANVASRTREIAMLRAIGATKSQIVRLVIGEALVLGTLGSILGVALGLHAAQGMNHMTVAIWGFQPNWTIPWDLVGPGIAFTMFVCLIAGIIPARRAARNNVIDALQTT